MIMKRIFTLEEARAIGKKIGVDFKRVELNQFRMGLSTELEHGVIDPETNVTNDNLEITAKIAWAHLKEIPDYYTHLAKMESEAESNEG